ncbi:MAG: neutral/alkaline non-lysosomal ceramidase N-terminal domain-containing protein [Planctomycetota bacterium]
MSHESNERLKRRDFLRQTIRSASLAGVGLSARPGHAAAAPALEAGEGTVNTTPPVGIEMAGFHRPPGKERRIEGIRQPTAARALVLKHGQQQAAVVSLDLCAVSRPFAKRVEKRVAESMGISASSVWIAATHTHSMPTFRYFRQWGAVSPEYMATVENNVVQAVGLARDDLAPAEMHVGRARVVDGNFNRTTPHWKTEDQFDQNASDAERWLDTALHALVFERTAGRRSLLWYHFSAHPVCYTDALAGPDWPGLVAEQAKARDNLAPSFLQGHCGDVNPGGGKPWLGIPEKVAGAVHAALEQAISGARAVQVDRLAAQSAEVPVPLDVPLLKTRLKQYRDDPSKCASGSYVDARFAADWAKGAQKWAADQTTLSVPISALRLGSVAMLFHPAELYSCYGLTIQRDSPTEHTLVVGYTNDLIGYLADPKAYEAGEYAALTVPGILDLPPYTPQAGRQFVSAAAELMAKVAG